MAKMHPRNTVPMRSSPRCGAKARECTPCQAPAVSGKRRRRMHGGAKDSGAPTGNQNAFKHGLYTSEAQAMRKYVRELTRRTREIIGAL